MSACTTIANATNCAAIHPKYEGIIKIADVISENRLYRSRKKSLNVRIFIRYRGGQKKAQQQQTKSGAKWILHHPLQPMVHKLRRRAHDGLRPKPGGKRAEAARKVGRLRPATTKSEVDFTLRDAHHPMAMVPSKYSTIKVSSINYGLFGENGIGFNTSGTRGRNSVNNSIT